MKRAIIPLLGLARVGLSTAVVAILVSQSGCYNLIHPLPRGVSMRGDVHPTADVRFLADLTYVSPGDVEGREERHVEQHIFDAALDIIGRAERFVLVDMFLYNDFQGEPPETTRALSHELTQALIDRKRQRPGLSVVVISDPVNTVYGGIPSPHFDALRDAGIPVVITRLDKLRDSNPGYSTFWRLLARPFGDRKVGLLPSPFSDEKVGVLNYLSLLNFKANHRKLVAADDGDQLVALVTSANPHDGSSAHGNVAAVFRGPAVLDLVESELAVIDFSHSKNDGEKPRLDVPPAAPSAGPASVQVLTEGKIREVLLDTLDRAGGGDEVDVAVFYISDHGVVNALTKARERGARVRVLLDPNKDAFGREKNGVPNRPVAADLHKGGVEVRWCDTHGEQCHAKMLLVRYRDGENVLLLGSANFTGRNLQDLNLETDVAIRGPGSVEALRDAHAYFETIWANEPSRRFSVGYGAYSDESLRKKFQYEIEERTGLSTF